MVYFGTGMRQTFVSPGSLWMCKLKESFYQSWKFHLRVGEAVRGSGKSGVSEWQWDRGSKGESVWAAISCSISANDLGLSHWIIWSLKYRQKILAMWKKKKSIYASSVLGNYWTMHNTSSVLDRSVMMGPAEAQVWAGYELQKPIYQSRT